NGFAAAGNRRGDLAVANHPECLSKRVIRGRTRGSNRVSGTVNAKLKRDAAGPRVSHGSRYGERREPWLTRGPAASRLSLAFTVPLTRLLPRVLPLITRLDRHSG